MLTFAEIVVLSNMAKNETDEELEFTNLKSDVKLRQDVQNLTFENPSDENSVKLILEQPYLCDSQRVWFDRLIKRRGAKFVEDLKPKVVNVIKKGKGVS